VGFNEMTRVSRVCGVREDLPLCVDLGEPYGTLESLGYVLVGLVDEDGNTGVGWTFSIDLEEARSIESAVRARAPLVEGVDPEAATENWARLAASTSGLARGVAAPAVSAFDVALWDLYGRQRGEPVHRLLGGHTGVLRTYASDALWGSLEADVLATNAARFRDEGFGALKIRTGGASDPRLEVDRVAAVRAAVGDETLILYDALQGYDVDSAIELGRALEPCGLGWFEDPVSEDDLAGLARVRSSVDIPVASGEDATWPEGHRALLAHSCVDVLMVDPKWVGGITPWRGVATDASARGVRMVSHISPELSAPILSAHAPEALLEWFPWSFGLYANPPTVEAGDYWIPDAPGFGLDYRADLLDRLFG
jgi:L-alanine-DL-glutamate epimerase-like enolase superfamily enzyme